MAPNLHILSEYVVLSSAASVEAAKRYILSLFLSPTTPSLSVSLMDLFRPASLLTSTIVSILTHPLTQLGIPTANIPITGATIDGRDIDSGVYYGWAGLSFTHSTSDASQAPLPAAPQEVIDKDAEAHPHPSSTTTHAATTNSQSQQPTIYPMVMSIGWNPYYANSVRSVEVHILHKFSSDFYNALMNLSIVGFIRPEQGYESMEALVEDINFDIEVARRSLEREKYVELKKDGYLMDFGWGKDVEKEKKESEA